MTREYQDTPRASVDWEARDGRFVLTIREAPDKAPIVMTLGYGDCEWALAAHERARRGPDFQRVLARDAVRQAGGPVLFASAVVDGGKWGFEIAAPFGIAGWEMLWPHGSDEARSVVATVKAAMAQEDAKP